MKKNRLTMAQKDSLKGWLFILPFVIGFLFFFFIPILQSIYFSFGELSQSAGGYTYTFKGVANYADALFGDSQFYQLIMAAIPQIVVRIPVILIFSFIMATLLKAEFPGRNAIRLIFFLPVIVSTGIVVTIEASDTAQQLISSRLDEAQAMIISEETLSGVLSQFNFPSKISSFLMTLINQILDIVNASGIQILIFLAALQSISPSLYEASAIEGATAWEEFWKITFPMVSPQMIVCLFYTVVDQFLVSNSSVISYINKLALPELQFGYSAAAGWIYTVLIIAVLAVFGLSLNAAVRRYDTV